MQNDTTNNEYIFIDDIQDLYSIKGATTTSWENNFSYENRPDENSIFILALVNTVIKMMVFTKSDLRNIRKICKIIKIYFGSHSVNIICDKNHTKEQILFKMINLPSIKYIIATKLDIIKYPLNNFVINDFNAYIENFDKVYQLVFQNHNNNNFNNNPNNKGNNNLNPNKSYKNNISTKMHIDNMKDINQHPAVLNDVGDNINKNFNFNNNFTNQFNNPMNIMVQNQIAFDNHMKAMNKGNQIIMNQMNINQQMMNQFIQQNNMQNKMPNVPDNSKSNSYIIISRLFI